jgi:LacI family transcriptional regulator
VNGEPWQDAARERLKGYRMELATADLPFAPELRDGDWSSGSGFENTRSLMHEPHAPTAIFCANDLMAPDAIEALSSLDCVCRKTSPCSATTTRKSTATPIHRFQPSYC